MLLTLRRLRRCDRGATAAEFAMAAPLIVTFVVGIIEVATYLFALTLMEASVREASRFGITGSTPAGVSREQQIREIVDQRTLGLIDMAQLVVSVQVYPSFGSIDQPEPYTDLAPHNGQYDVGEPFTDVNGNGQWDADMGAAGAGGPGAVVVYTLSYPWRLLTHMFDPIIGDHGVLTLRASIAVRNEPFPTP